MFVQHEGVYKLKLHCITLCCIMTDTKSPKIQVSYTNLYELDGLVDVLVHPDDCHRLMARGHFGEF